MNRVTNVLLFAAICCVSVSCVKRATGAQPKKRSAKIRLIVLLDEQDASVGPYSLADMRRMIELFSKNVPRENLEVNTWRLHELNGAALRRRISRLQVNSDDAVVFYFSGHGGYHTSIGHFLQLHQGRESLKRATLLEDLRRKRARLTVLLTESCFNFVKTPPPPTKPPPLAGFPLPRAEPLFESLFFDCRGVVDLNACQKGQKSWTNPDISEGSIFTTAFVEVANSQMQKRLDWRQFTALVEEQTDRRFKTTYPAGVTTRTENGRVRQRSQQPSFVTPLSVVMIRGERESVKTFTSRENQIDPATGRITQLELEHTLDPQTGRVRSKVLRRHKMGVAMLAYSFDGTPVYEGAGLTVLAEGIAKGPPRKPFGLVRYNISQAGLDLVQVAPNYPIQRCRDVNTGELLRLEQGDRITSLNSQRGFRSRADVGYVIRSSPDLIPFSVLDVRTNKTRQMVANLRPPAAKTYFVAKPVVDKLGLTVENNLYGVVVRGVEPGGPAARCKDRKGNSHPINVGDYVFKLSGRMVMADWQYHSLLRDDRRSFVLGVVPKKTGRLVMVTAKMPQKAPIPE